MIHLDLKNKPLTLFIAGPILGLGMIMGAVYFVYSVVSFFYEDGFMQLFMIVFAPFLVIYILQSLAYLAAAFILLRSIYLWSSAGIVLNIFLTPLAFLIVTLTIANQYGVHVDLSSPFGVSAFLFFFLGSFALAVVAYNDIKYRKKSLFQ